MRLLSETSQENEESSGYISFGVIPIALGIGLLSRVILSKTVKLPYTVVMLLFGSLFGLIYANDDTFFNPALNKSLESWINMDPRILQVIFFPILIFVSGFNSHFHIMEKRFLQILTLAIPGMIMGAVLTAVLFRYILPYEWDWNSAMVIGAMLAPTDPVSIVALLEELGVSEKLGTLIEGESLFNDGSAIVVFEVFLEALEGHSRSWDEVIEFGSRLALGGPVVGIVAGFVGAFIIGYIVNDPLAEIILTVIISYGTFALCESTELKVSGVLGLVTCGLVMSYYGKPRISPSVVSSMGNFWKTLQYFADTTIFFISGLIIVGITVNRDRDIDWEDFGYLIIVFTVLYLIRALVVFLSMPVLSRGEYKVTVPQAIVIVHSGIRGAVSLILALIVDSIHEIEQSKRDKMVFMVAGVSVLSLLINGTTAGALVRYLKLDRSSEDSICTFEKMCYELELEISKDCTDLKESNFLLEGSNWEIVWRYIPIFTSKSYWSRIINKKVKLSQKEIEDICDSNDSCMDTNTIEDCKRAIKSKIGGLTYQLPHRIRSNWYKYNTTYMFKDSSLPGNMYNILKESSGIPEYVPSFNIKEEDIESGSAVETDIESNIRFLDSISSSYLKYNKEGSLSGSGLRVLSEMINISKDNVENGGGQNQWDAMSIWFNDDLIEKYTRWLPLSSYIVNRRIGFQVDLVWNFIEAHKESRFSGDQVGKALKTLENIGKNYPEILSKSLTRIATRIVIRKYKEYVEEFCDKGKFSNKEGEFIMHSLTDIELKLTY